ncbi:MAG: efflux RND transporter periplasmic adaptor subunit [Chitinophagaceae bacterium]
MLKYINSKQMKPYAIITTILFLVACGSGNKDNASGVAEKKVLLASLKKDQLALTEKISTLEQEIAKLDPSSVVEKIKLVGVSVIEVRDFTHYIDLQGKIATENLYNVSPRGMGGQVKEIYIKQGDFVKKGQLLLRLDDALVQQNIKQLETQLEFAKNIFVRQKNLWNEGIGTEVQFLTAKNNVEGLEKQMAIVKEQSSTSRVYAEVSGIAETVNIRAGELFTGSPLAGITIVNPSSLKATVDVPENYVSKIRKGMPVVVEVPDLGKSFNTQVTLISEIINNNSRSFIAESKLPASPQLKPNQLAVVRILDHQSKNALVVPVETIQTDDKGKYVFVLKDENGKKVARKIPVTIGEFYDAQIEVKSGLSVGEQLITKGFQGLYEGQLIATEIK